MNALRTIRGSYLEMATQTVGSPEREKKKENFTAKGSNVQTGLLTQQRIEQIPKRPLPPARGIEAGVRQPEPEGKGLLQSRSQRPASSTEM